MILFSLSFKWVLWNYEYRPLVPVLAAVSTQTVIISRTPKIDRDAFPQLKVHFGFQRNIIEIQIQLNVYFFSGTIDNDTLKVFKQIKND